MSTDQRTTVALFSSDDKLKIEISMNFAEGPNSHLSIACTASTELGTKAAYPGHREVEGINVIEGDIDPDSIEVDFSAIGSDVQRLTIRAYPYQAITTLGALELYADFTATTLWYANEYQPTTESFTGIDWFELVRNDNSWELFALAGTGSVTY